MSFWQWFPETAQRTRIWWYQRLPDGTDCQQRVDFARPEEDAMLYALRRLTDGRVDGWPSRADDGMMQFTCRGLTSGKVFKVGLN